MHTNRITGNNDQVSSAIGGYRVTAELPLRRQPRAMSPSPLASRGPTPAEWRAAEAELQEKTVIPLEPSSAPVTTARRRPVLFPTVGRTFQAVGGTEVEIAEVLGHDGATWFVADKLGQRFALRRVILTWNALPRSSSPPAPGDIIVHGGGESELIDVFGEAALGGWAVSSPSGAIHHVLHSDANRWVSVAVV